MLKRMVNRTATAFPCSVAGLNVQCSVMNFAVFCAANRSEALTTRVSQTRPSTFINSSSDIPARISGPFFAFLSIWAKGPYVPFNHVDGFIR
jgi:hypothetical protein